MKKYLFIPLFTLIAISSVAQYRLNTEAFQINGGLGFSNYQGLPIYLGVDYGLKTDISVGGEVSYRNYKASYATSSIPLFSISANGNYHFVNLLDIPDEWDVYAGLSPNLIIGADIFSFGIGAQIGGRYYFNNSLAVNLELRGGTLLSQGKLGISYIF